MIEALENALDPSFPPAGINWGDGYDLRIGVKVQGFEDGGSESFVNGPQVPTAAPRQRPFSYWNSPMAARAPRPE